MIKILAKGIHGLENRQYLHVAILHNNIFHGFKNLKLLFGKSKFKWFKQH
jgi:hypothetical protein